MTPHRATAVGVAVLAMSAVASPIRAQQPELAGVGHDLGDADAPVVVVEYADFACGACAQFATSTWPEIRHDFVDTGRVRWKIVPFELGFRNSEEGARAAECAAAQDGFWVMHDHLYASRDAWVDERNPRDALEDLASEAGLDVALFRECYAERPHRDRIKAANRAARDAGVRGTPTFFVNGFQVQGALPADAFRQVLEEQDVPEG